jgi:hypothetical protein
VQVCNETGRCYAERQHGANIIDKTCSKTVCPTRYIITWKLCATMKVGDVTETLNLALQASGSITRGSFIVPDYSRTMVPPSVRMAGQTQHGSCARRAVPSADTGQDCSWHQTLKNRILPARSTSQSKRRN